MPQFEIKTIRQTINTFEVKNSCVGENVIEAAEGAGKAPCSSPIDKT